jgi:hypothetical protein
MIGLAVFTVIGMAQVSVHEISASSGVRRTVRFAVPTADFVLGFSGQGRKTAS